MRLIYIWHPGEFFRNSDAEYLLPKALKSEKLVVDVGANLRKERLIACSDAIAY
jgi:hypothetical protein